MPRSLHCIRDELGQGIRIVGDDRVERPLGK